MPGWIREGVTLLALLFLVVVTAAAVAQTRRVERALDAAAHALQRASVNDDLVGRLFDDAGLGIGTTDRFTFVWLVDLDRCAGCVDTVTDWVTLEGLDDHEFVLVLAGTSSPSLERRVRMLKRTRVLRWPSGSIASRLGLVLPNTKLLLSPDGVITLADSRAAGQGCRWSFEAQAAVLRGLDPKRPIREYADVIREDAPPS